MLGNPKFKREEQVSFIFTTSDSEQKLDGVIYIVDAYGTFEQKDEPSYDIMALYNGEKMLFKHIPESQVMPRES